MTSGAFVRQQSRFRGHPHGGPERHHLYVALACPWSQRAVIVRAVLGLDELGISYAHPYRDERGWAFTGGRFTDDDQRLGLPRAGLPRDRPRLRRPRQRPRPVGHRGRRDRLQRVRRHHPHLQRVGRRRPLPGAAARRDRRAQRVDLRGAAERRLPRRVRALAGGLRGGVPRRVRRARAAGSALWKTVGICSATRSPRPIGACCRRCCASTPSTTRTSAATASG